MTTLIRFDDLVELPASEAYSPLIVDQDSTREKGKRLWRRADWDANMAIHLHAEMVEHNDKEIVFLGASGSTSMGTNSQQPENLRSKSGHERNFHDIVEVELEVDAPGRNDVDILQRIPATANKVADYEYKSGITIGGSIDFKGKAETKTDSDGVSGTKGIEVGAGLSFTYESSQTVSTKVEDFEFTATQNSSGNRKSGHWSYQLRQVYSDKGPQLYDISSNPSEIVKRLVKRSRGIAIQRPAFAATSAVAPQTQMVISAPLDRDSVSGALIARQRVVHCKNFGGVIWLSYAIRTERRPFVIDFKNGVVRKSGDVEVSETGACNHPTLAASFPKVINRSEDLTQGGPVTRRQTGGSRQTRSRRPEPRRRRERVTSRRSRR